MIYLEEINTENQADALAIRGKPGQERFVSSVAESLAQAEQFGGGGRVTPMTTTGSSASSWAASATEPFLSGVWKLLISGDEQGKGYGRAVEAVAEEAQRRGHAELGVFFHPGPDGPAGFWLRLGFTTSGKYCGGAEIHTSRPL
jgi:diamine N-acetyltransferase